LEPLTFKGREVSGHAGGRCGYADASLTPKYDWKKFELFYRVWGRRLYDPDADAEAWGRWLRSRLGSAAGATETALANASRVLPLVTSAHLASASNHSFWPEIYDNMPIVAGSEKSPYGDTPEPRVFGTVSPLDPQMFSTIAEFAGELLTGTRSGKYSPIEVAVWLEEFTGTSAQALAVARAAAGAKTAAEFRRVEEDVLIQNGLGRFFAAKLRSGVLFEVFEQTGSAEAGRLAVERYQAARDAWAAMAKRAAKVYGPDVSYGSVPQRRGHWMDRLPGIDVDLAAMRSKVQSGAVAAGDEESAARAVRVATGKGRRAVVDCEHMPPAAFHAGEALKVEVRLRAGSGSSMVLWYRHVNQAERWRRVDMVGNGGGFGAAIPGAYTESAYPLQYYFEGQSGAGEAWVYPGLNSTLSNQPYYAIAKRSA